MSPSAPSAALRRSAGKRVTNVQRSGGGGADDSGPVSDAPPSGTALTRPRDATISPPRDSIAARASASVAKRRRGSPSLTSSGLNTSTDSSSAGPSDTTSPPRSTTDSGAPCWRPASARASASGAKKCVALTCLAK